MMKWQKRTIKWDKNFPITTRKGNNLFVANRGDVSFEYPSGWITKPSETSICFYDAEPPADQCVLEFSILPLQIDVDWGKVPLEEMLCQAVGGHAGKCDRAAIQTMERDDLKIVWMEYDFTDPIEKRLALSRCALAVKAAVLPLITFSFWPEEKKKWEPVWKDILETLRVGQGARFKERN
jgi:hypothetical protein